MLQLSDLLSYLLYECDEAKVALEKEISMMKEYMLLEKEKYGNKLELEIVIRGNMDHQMIAPLLLLPFIENSFKHCNSETEQPWINLDINVENEVLSMKLLNGVDPMAGDQTLPELTNIERRLQLLYPGKHELKRYIEQEIYVVLLKIVLHNRPAKETPLSKLIHGHEVKKDYAYN